MNFLRLSAPLFLALLVTGCPSAPKLDLPEPPRIDKFTATPATVMRGAMVTLEWATTDATDVEIVEIGVGPLAGVDNRLSGTSTVTVTGPALFVLNASNSRGVKVTSLATVSVEGAGQQVMFAALPGSVAPGGSVTLVWTAPGARTVAITPAGGAALDLRGQIDTGSVVVTPTSPTRYTLSADGTTKTVDVVVTQALTSFTATKSPVPDAGEQVTLSWRTVNATRVLLQQPGSGVIADVGADGGTMLADGMATHPLPGYPAGSVVPYLLTVEGAGPAIVETRNVVVGDGPAIVSFEGPEYARTGTTFQLKWKTLNADVIELSAGGAVVYRSLTAAEAADGAFTLTTPAAQTDYTLTAIHTLGDVRVTKTFTQKVIGPASVTAFTATPGTIPAGGDPVTLTWNVPNARRLVITDGAGHTVASAHGAAAEMGTGTAYPNTATTYVLTADNTVDAPLSATAMVQVTAPASFGAASYVLAGNPYQVSWTVGAPQGLQGTPASSLTTQMASGGFVDISTTGTKLVFAGGSDDGTAAITPQDFETFLYGSRVSGTFTVSTNGFVALVPAASARPMTGALPNMAIERNFVAPWWGDLTVPMAGGVYWQVLNEAPERTLVVQWDHVAVKGEPTSDLTFEAKIHQTGLVTFEYRTLSHAGSVLPVVGVQGTPTSAAAGPVPTSNGAMTFFGPTQPPLSFTLSAAAPVGGFIKLMNGYLRPSFIIPVIVPGDIAVTEVHYNPAAAIAATGEWVEVTNLSDVPVDLFGWNVDLADAGTFTVDASVPLPAKASVVLGQETRGPLNDDVNTAYAYGPLAMPDSSGTVAVHLGAYRSTVTYTAALAGSDAGVSVNTDSQPHLVTGDSSTAAPHPLSCNSTTPIGSQTPRQLATPGVLQRCGNPFTLSTIPVSYYDISATGTPLFTSANGGFDENIETFDLTGNPFTFEGQPVTTVTVSSNGFILLKNYTGTSAITNKTAPSASDPSGSVASVFWDDLEESSSFAATANAYFKRVAPGEDAANPGGHWIVQWHHFSHYLVNDDLNFQVKLFDTGVIEYHFAAMVSGSTSNYANGNSATVWLENTAGNSALTVSRNQAAISPNSAYRFAP